MTVIKNDNRETRSLKDQSAKGIILTNDCVITCGRNSIRFNEKTKRGGKAEPGSADRCAGASGAKAGVRTTAARATLAESSAPTRAAASTAADCAAAASGGRTTDRAAGRGQARARPGRAFEARAGTDDRTKARASGDAATATATGQPGRKRLSERPQGPGGSARLHRV